MKRKTTWLILLSIVMVAALIAAWARNRNASTEYLTARVERGEIDDVVEATGTINAVITVQVGSQVSGTIAKLYADFNSRVKKGDVVAMIDPSLFKGAMLQAAADWENAKANFVAARANKEKAEALSVQTKAEYLRTSSLTEAGVMSPQQLDVAKANYDSAVAAEHAAVATVAQAAAQVEQKDAAVKVAQTNLNYTVIRSPIDGTVVARNVDVGQTVAASLQAPTIFTIAQDLTKMWVYAKTDESDVGNIKVGKPVSFKVDAFPKDIFHGVVSQVRMNPTTVQSVVTYDTIIEFANPELKLFPGMTAYVTIPVDTVRDVLKLPNTALRYKPPMSPQQVLAIYKQHNIETAEQNSDNSGVSPASPSAAQGTHSMPREKKTETAVIWKLLPDKTVEPVQISLGITDHAFTQITSVLNGQLKQGDDLVIRSISSKSQTPGGIGR